MKRIYVAGKLNDGAVGFIKNCHNMLKWAETIRKMGYAVYVPCLDVLLGMYTGCYEYEDYFDNSQPWLDAADAVFVCPGWETSDGTRREIERAGKAGIPVYFNVNELNGEH